jgi:hypothetical protein
MTREWIADAWAQHRGQEWPSFSNPNQGQLMTLDTVISGCVVYFLDSPEGLDPQRVSILQDCLNDLDMVIEELDTDVQSYFLGLRRLCTMLLEMSPTC